MGLRGKPTQRQKRLGRELQRLREHSGLSASDAGARIGVGRAHLSHIEAGRTHASAEKVRALAAAYGCTRDPLIDELAAMAEATGRGWWTEYKETLSPQLLDLAETEQAATGHRSFEWLYVPGLLQTADYMRDLFRSSNTGVSADLLARYAEFRSRRQQILTREPRPTVHVVIHEAAFHMGFVSRETRAAQLEYLIEASLAPNVTIQLLPFSTPTNPAALGAFTILDARVPELRTVNVEQPTHSLFLTEPSEIEQYTAHFDRLNRVALAPLDPTSPYGEGTFGLVQYLLYALKEDRRVRP